MKRIRLSPPGKLSKVVLRLDFAITVLFGVALLLSFLRDLEAHPARAMLEYPYYLEYIFCGICLSVASFVVTEFADRGRRF